MLNQFLGSIGFEPIKVTDKEELYISPFNPSENTPSFYVFPNKAGEWSNWKNYASGDGGDIYKFIMEYYKINFPQAKQKLEDFTGGEITHSSFNQPKMERPLYQMPPSQKSTAKKSYNIKKTQNLQNKALLAYLSSRGIVIPPLDNEHPLKHTLMEVYYELNGKNYFALSFFNNSDGMEVRNEYFKGSFGSKNYTTLLSQSSVKPSTIKIFEGFIDFLSYTIINPDYLVSDYMIMNSLSFTDDIIISINRNNYQMVELYLDNDLAGDIATIKICDSSKISRVIDKRKQYRKYADVNDLLQKKEIVLNQKKYKTRVIKEDGIYKVIELGDVALESDNFSDIEAFIR